MSTKRTIADYYGTESQQPPKKKIKLSKINEQTTKPENKKPMKWHCKKIWDFEQNGGIFNCEDELNDALKFYEEKGFVVFKDAIDEKENDFARELLLNDLKQIIVNKNLDINDLSQFTNKLLPGWSSNGIRYQFGISHGTFANYSRLRPNIKKIFAHFHECEENELCCSWDSVAITPHNAKHKNTLWLHADQQIYDHDRNKMIGWNYNSIQGALYYTESNPNTVSFVCTPYSHTKYWKKIAKKTKSPTAGTQKHWLLLDQLCVDDDKKWSKIRENIINGAYRIHVPKNGFLLWNSKVFHQNCDALNNANNKEMKRIAQLISMSPNKLRDFKAFRNSLIYAINGTTSVHWSQFMWSLGRKHPRFSRGNCYENMTDLKPKLNEKMTQQQFEKMIPTKLIGKKVKIYPENNMESLTLSNVNSLGVRDLQQFKMQHLWDLIDPKLKTLQPWIDH